jgi:hypothetical protein
VESATVESAPVESAPAASAPVEPATAESAAVEPATPAASAPDGGPDETEGARLVALNMALDGTPREQTAQYLSEHFRLADRDGLLDEVYSSVEN